MDKFNGPLRKQAMLLVIRNYILNKFKYIFQSTSKASYVEQRKWMSFALIGT